MCGYEDSKILSILEFTADDRIAFFQRKFVFVKLLDKYLLFVVGGSKQGLHVSSKKYLFLMVELGRDVILKFRSDVHYL